MGTAWTENRTYKIGGKTRFRAPAHTGTTTGTPTGTRAAGDVGPYHAPRPLDVTALDIPLQRLLLQRVALVVQLAT